MHRFLHPSQWERVMVFAPHPDDESLTTGGLLQQAVQAGATVRVIFITDGDNNPWPQHVIERRWKIEAPDRARWSARRQREALAALAVLGVPPHCARFLSYPDQSITRLMLNGGEELTEKLVREIADFQPKLVVSPALTDCHKDHNAFAVLLQCAIGQLASDGNDFTEINYITHGRRRSRHDPYELKFQLTPAQQTRKRDAILCHTSQMRLSRRRFVAFAKESEYFRTRPEVASQSDNHSVRSVGVQGDVLRIELDSGLVLRGKQVLHIVINHLRRTVALPSKSSSVNVVDATCGTITTQARFVSGLARRELFIPLSALMPGERIFMKLASERGFYDNSGWREIPALQENPHTCDHPIALSAVQPSPRVCCVLPCYNVADKCGEVLRQITPLVHQVIAVNDGSTDGTREVLHKIAAQSNGRIRVLSYPDNRGKGAALLNAFRMALSEIPFDLIITIDADGQHNPEDIPRLVEASVRQRAAMVIGERIQVKAMPLRSRLGNGLTRALFRWLYPFSPQDTQSGLRAMSRDLVLNVVKSIKTQRYETELQILLLVLQSHQRLSTIAIKTIYFDKNRLSHFRPVADSFRIYWTLIKWHLPFINPIAREEKASK